MPVSEGSVDTIDWFRELSDAETSNLSSLHETSLGWLDQIPFSTKDNDNPTYATKSTPLSTEPHLQLCQNPQGSCITMATGFLKSIHAHSTSCVMGIESNHQPQQQINCTVDDVLSTTQEASRVLRGLVQCRCHNSPQLQLLVTVICSEAIFWYRRIIATYSSGHGNATNMDSERDGLQEENERAPLQRRPFCIGNHQFEGHQEAILIGQVLSSRLQELGSIIGDVAWKTSPWSQGTMGSGVGEDGGTEMLPERVHTRSNGFLKDQLNAARRELASGIIDANINSQ